MRHLAWIALLLAASADAAVYKCEMPGGRMAYQSQPCPQNAVAADKTDLMQRAEPRVTPEPEPATAETTTTAVEPPSEAPAKPKTWLEKRAEEREASKEARKAEHDQRVSEAEERIRFEKLIWDKQIAVGMSESQVREAWGKPTKINKRLDAGGAFDQWVYRRYKNRTYIGSNYVHFRNGKVISMDY